MKKTAQIDYLSDMGNIVKAYEEIAAFRIRRVKDEVLKNRGFTSELNEIYKIVKNTYQKEVEKYKYSLGQNKNGKTVRVFLSANTGLYGDMVQRIFNLYTQDLAKPASDFVVIGSLGKTLLSSTNPLKTFKYFEVPDKQMVLEEFKEIIDFLLPYETVIVYHGLFKNILMQDAVSTNLSGDWPFAKDQETSIRPFIFEPSLPLVLNFFENEMFSSLLTQVIFESQLAKFSARMASLEQAGENIKKEALLAKRENMLHKKRVFDKKQIEALSGRRLWEQ